MTGRKHSHPGDPDDPIERYREWADNRYNPGRWLGANTPPYTKNLWSTKDRRWLGWLYVSASVIAFGVVVSRTSDASSLVWAAVVLSTFFVPGLIMLLSRDRKRGRRRP